MFDAFLSGVLFLLPWEYTATIHAMLSCKSAPFALGLSYLLRLNIAVHAKWSRCKKAEFINIIKALAPKLLIALYFDMDNENGCTRWQPRRKICSESIKKTENFPK